MRDRETLQAALIVVTPTLSIVLKELFMWSDGKKEIPGLAVSTCITFQSNKLTGSFAFQRGKVSVLVFRKLTHDKSVW